MLLSAESYCAIVSHLSISNHRKRTQRVIHWGFVGAPNVRSPVTARGTHAAVFSRVMLRFRAVAAWQVVCLAVERFKFSGGPVRHADVGRTVHTQEWCCRAAAQSNKSRQGFIYLTPKHKVRSDMLYVEILEGNCNIRRRESIKDN